MFCTDGYDIILSFHQKGVLLYEDKSYTMTKHYRRTITKSIDDSNEIDNNVLTQQDS